MNLYWLIPAFMCFGLIYITYLGKKAWDIAQEAHEEMYPELKDRTSGGSK